MNTPANSVPESATRYFAAVALLTISVAFVFGPVLTHEFIAIDFESYTGNPAIQAGLSREGIEYAFTAVVASNWHPVTVLAHMTLHSLFGPDPAAHYAANLVLHWINTLLVFEIFRRATGFTWRSILVAALFGLHPLRVESVAWTAELKDVLSATFAFLTVLAYLRFVATRNRSWYALAAFVFALGLLAKASIVILPLLLIMLDFWPLNRFRSSEGNRSLSAVRAIALEKFPMLLIAIAMTAITLATFQESTLKSTATLSLFTRAAMACIAYKDYLLSTFWPAHLSPHYPYLSPTAPLMEAAASAALLVVVSAFAFSQRRAHPYLLVGWLWFVISILPVSGILPVGTHYRADRYTYIAHAGFFAGVVWYVSALVPRRSALRRGAATAAVLAVVGLATSSYLYVHRWRDNVTLFEYAARSTPESALVRSGWAIGLIQQRRLGEAEVQLRESLRINPDYLPDLKRLASVLVLTDRPGQSVEIYEAIVKAQPNSGNLVGLAIALEQAGDRARALTTAESALVLHPENPAASEIVERLRRVDERIDENTSLP